MESRAPRVGHRKSRKGCAQCKRRHVKCNEQSPCSNCVRHGVLCSLAGGPNVQREDAKSRSKSTTSNSPTHTSRTASVETSVISGNASSSAAEVLSAGSPFTVLTGSIDRSLPGQDQNWQFDLRLMHHYTTHAQDVLTERSNLEFIVRIWKEELAKVAFTCDYVMHALLGFTALHEAHLEPENAAMLQTSAVDHMDKALVLCRRESGGSGSENANAKFIFAWLVALFAYAIPPSVPPLEAVVELFSLVKGIDAVLAETWYYVAQGPFAPILTRGFQEALRGQHSGMTSTHSMPKNMDFGINHLDFMLGTEPMLSEDRRVCVLILAELKTIYDAVRNNNNQPGGSCSVASILCFPKQDSTPFASLIKRRVPQALIILGYYCVLLDVLNDRWWIQGWAESVLTDVVASLDESWKHWVDWPCASVLWKNGGPPDPTAMLVG
ncbi:hypothetical protein DOTSEDRAFT_72207 [Lecanosticta acicola]|uniref:Zn(2)-C6 fungal-type domain-containing protein n=1 Tax=Lecanosticta acicola TaxID=111012 RepID=A0AAI8Z634_9PEZI|nr:hypothetical protein DOTSEDRAFT_72207 [Lecanosticta acicola]